jgi:hypothetical protein
MADRSQRADLSSMDPAAVALKGSFHSKSVKQLVRWMCEADASRRPTISQVQSHRWFRTNAGGSRR